MARSLHDVARDIWAECEPMLHPFELIKIGVDDAWHRVYDYYCPVCNSAYCDYEEVKYEFGCESDSDVGKDGAFTWCPF